MIFQTGKNLLEIKSFAWVLDPLKRENVPILVSEMSLKIANVNQKPAPAIMLKCKKDSFKRPLNVNGPLPRSKLAMHLVSS